MTSDAVVYLVDDDPAVLKSMHWLVESANFSAQPLTSAGMFLDEYDPHRPGCLILDVRMPADDRFAIASRRSRNGASYCR